MIAWDLKGEMRAKREEVEGRGGEGWGRERGREEGGEGELRIGSRGGDNAPLVQNAGVIAPRASKLLLRGMPLLLKL